MAIEPAEAGETVGNTDTVQLERLESICIVRLNRPEHLNAVNGPMHSRLSFLWSELSQDPQIRVVIVTGSGQAFCGGADLAWMKNFIDDAEFRRTRLLEAKTLVRDLIKLPMPVIAAVNGPAVGLGCSIALLCDMVLMSRDAYFADPHVALGLVAGDGGAAVWPILINLLKAKEFLFSGERIGSSQAVELGLANRALSSNEDLLIEAQSVAKRWSRLPKFALQETKRALNMHLERALPILEYGIAAEGESFLLEEHRTRLATLAGSSSQQPAEE